MLIPNWFSYINYAVICLALIINVKQVNGTQLKSN